MDNVLNIANNNSLLHCYIYNAMGKLVKEEECINSLDLSGILPGIYVLKAGEFTVRFIKAESKT